MISFFGKRIIAAIIVIFLLISIGCSSTYHCQRSGYSDDILFFLDMMNKSNNIQDIGEAFWVLEIYEETNDAFAWVGESIDGHLHAYSVRYSLDEHMPTFLDKAIYVDFSPASESAIKKIFAANLEWSSGSDYWAGSWRCFAGCGYTYAETVVPHKDSEFSHIFEWLDNPSAPNNIESVYRFPIELAMPWLVSRYYSAERMAGVGVENSDSEMGQSSGRAKGVDE